MNTSTGQRHDAPSIDAERRALAGESDAVRVLVVDRGDTSATLATQLARWSYDVATVTTGSAALAAPQADVVVVARHLSDVDGLDVCRALRRNERAPIIVLTGDNDEDERIAGIETGADHYLAKPIVVRELVARVRASHRRRGAPARAANDVDALVIDRRTRRVLVGGEAVYLTPKEYELLVFLADGGDRVQSASCLMSNVWDAHWYGSTKTVATHISKLRAKLGNAVTITKVGASGYRFGLGPGDRATNAS